MKDYFTKKWQEFRGEVIELDGYACCHCGKKKSDEVILQVHHKKYIKGLKPWEYALKECETITKAKIKVFSFIESGEAAQYFNKIP